jgi:hypothetical protein
MSSSTQLTNCADFDVSKIMFSEPETKSIPNTPISYNRINISYENNDGSMGDLIIPTEHLFSFGLQENTDMTSGKVNGYSIPLVLWNKNGATESETLFVDTIEAISETCQEHVLSDDIKEKVGKYDLVKSDLKKFNPIYRKREKGKIVEGRSPCLYPKVIVNKKDGGLRINTFFVDSNTNQDIDPLTLLEKRMHCTCGIKIESIFVGRTISLQVKVYECVAEIVDSGMKRLLSVKPTTKTPVTMNDQEEEEEEEGSIDGEEEVVVLDQEEVEEKPKKRGGRKKKATS